MTDRRKNLIQIFSAALLAGLVLSSCSGTGSGTDTAAPTFCPDRYSSGLAQPLAADSSPRVYYQDLVTTGGTPLDIVLYTCDPDHPETSEGLSWEVAVPPFWDGPPPPPYHGSLSAYFGSYPAGGVITYTPDPGYLGTDSFPIHVWDGTAWSNTAEILITVNASPLTGQRLYFGGKDDLDRTHLWYYDGSSPIATISGSAQALSQYGLIGFDSGLPDPGGIHFLVSDSSGENLHPLGFNVGTQSFQNYPAVDNVGEQIPYGPLLYVTAQVAGGGTSYLWYSDSGGFLPISGTANIYPSSLEVFNSKLYFAGNTGGGSQVMSYNSAGGILTTETSIGTNLWPRDLTVCNGKLYFNGTFGTVASYEYLWAIDGTSPAATVTNGVTSPENMICFNNELYFTAMGAPGSTMPVQLWSIDSSDNLSRWTTNASANFMFPGLYTYPVILGSDLYMRGNDDTYTSYIWVHDGSSPISTVPGSDGLFPFYTTVFDGKLFFSSSATAYDQLWSYDPGTGAIGALSNITMGLYPRGLTVYPP